MMITIDCPICHLWHAPEIDCTTEEMHGRSWLVRPPVDDPMPDVPEPAKIIGTITLKRRGRPPKHAAG